MMDSQKHLSWARPDQCDIELLDQLWIEKANIENLLQTEQMYKQNEYNSTAHTCIMLGG